MRAIFLACIFFFSFRFAEGQTVDAIRFVFQQNIRFMYIGSEPHSSDGVLITSGEYQGDYLKGKDSRLTKIYYTNQRTLDTLRAFISRSIWVKHGDTSRREASELDTAKLSDAYKITGVDTCPLFVKGKDCCKLFLATMQYLGDAGLFGTSGYNAVDHLLIECDSEFLIRHLIPLPRDTTRDLYRIEDTPRVRAVPNKIIPSGSP